ncbi:hypothetical protein E1N52_32460 [Paraburkholderia guartelaensis]|uniref:Uncharacterized protein n=1 Tax=Paraburkholderia guartelaensis TaxID=2546446 RepID=A0A4R5L592_9BURK|nr:hypothetical protein [Paraburkholderia guartelaensis]TDG03935.1 hypothetical protein E1N52_32460 [Paraburkholderia guartelaensis]
MGPWTTDDIRKARGVSYSAVLNYLGAHHKRDPSYEPLDRSSKSVRVNVNFEGREFRFILTGEKWFNELAANTPGRGGGGTIDFVRHLTGTNFVHAVKICLEAQIDETDTAGRSVQR